MYVGEDYYQVLGVSRDASKDDIKSAFKEKAREYHPDRSDHPDAEEKFKRISKAYEVLADEEMRARYDRYGEEGVKTSAAGGRRRSRGFTDLQDLLDEMGFRGFSDLFGGGRGGSRGRGRRRRRGSDLKMAVELDFDEAVFGCEKELSFEKNEVCENCDGSGSPTGDTEVCNRCDGRGKVSRSQGFFRVTETCPQCRGQGEIVTDPCGECRGSGTVRREQTLRADIPAGVSSGDRIGLEGEGEPGPAGRGDLYLEIRVRPHDRFHRRDFDLHTAVPVSFPRAALGGTVSVPLLEGDDAEETEIELPEGVQSGEEFVVRGRGVPRLRGGGRGDLHVTVQVVTPTDLSAEERDLLEALAEKRGMDVQSPEKKQGLFERFAEAFGGGG